MKRAWQVGAPPWFNHQGQAHIVSTAIRSPGPARGPAEVGGAPWFRTWFSVDPQPASISPTVNISIVFICAVLDCGRIIHYPAIKNELRLPKNVHAKRVHRRQAGTNIKAILARSSARGPTEWQHMGNWIHAAFIFGGADFVSVCNAIPSQRTLR
jgi:hypothetical protein